MDKEGGKKAGVSVQEIENFAKKHRFEVFYCIAFILAAFFSYMFLGPAWSIFLGALGGVLGIWMPNKVDRLMGKLLSFIFKQETITQIVLGVVVWILAIFLPPLIFLFLGLMGGKACFFQSASVSGRRPPNE